MSSPPAPAPAAPENENENVASEGEPGELQPPAGLSKMEEMKWRRKHNMKAKAAERATTGTAADSGGPAEAPKTDDPPVDAATVQQSGAPQKSAGGSAGGEGDGESPILGAFYATQTHRQYR